MSSIYISITRIEDKQNSIHTYFDLCNNLDTHHIYSAIYIQQID